MSVHSASEQWFSSMKGFLPEGSVVMARVAPPSESVASAVLASVASVAPLSVPTPVYSLVFVAPDLSHWQGETGALLDRMLAAIGLSRPQVGCVCEESAALAHQPRVIVGLGVRVSGWGDEVNLHCFDSTSLPELLADAQKKRQTWQQLKSVASILGLTI